MSWVGPTVALGLVASVVAALPGASRAASDIQPAAALALSGAVSLVVVPVGWWLRGSHTGGRLKAADRALLLGAGLSLLPLAFFGGVLKSSTHHRPLGGATFAVGALLVLAACVVLAFRFSRARHAAPSSPWPSPFSLALALSLGGTWLLAAGAAGRPHLLDFGLLVAAIAATALPKFPARLARAPAWPLLVSWGVLVALAIATTRVPEVAQTLASRAPVSFASLSWLGDGS